MIKSRNFSVDSFSTPALRGARHFDRVDDTVGQIEADRFASRGDAGALRLSMTPRSLLRHQRSSPRGSSGPSQSNSQSRLRDTSPDAAARNASSARTLRDAGSGTSTPIPQDGEAPEQPDVKHLTAHRNSFSPTPMPISTACSREHSLTGRPGYQRGCAQFEHRPTGIRRRIPRSVRFGHGTLQRFVCADASAGYAGDFGAMRVGIHWLHVFQLPRCRTQQPGAQQAILRRSALPGSRSDLRCDARACWCCEASLDTTDSSLGYDRVYLTVSTLKPKQHAAASRPFVSHTLAAALKLKFPQIAAVARLATRPWRYRADRRVLSEILSRDRAGQHDAIGPGSVHSLGPRPPQAGASRGRSSGRPSKWAPVRSRCPECAGLYPALILSSFRPAIVLKGIVVRVTGANVAVSGSSLCSLPCSSECSYRRRSCISSASSR